LVKKLSIIVSENVTDIPLSLGPHPLASLSGSDHNKSHNKPNIFYFNILPCSGISVGLTIFLSWSKELKSGLSPPCIHRILSSTDAIIGKQLKQSVNIFHSLTEYLRLHSS
jgi:hypothetical protein